MQGGVVPAQPDDANPCSFPSDLPQTGEEPACLGR